MQPEKRSLGLGEGLAVWALLAADVVAVLVVYSLVDPSELHNVTRDGLAGGLGRALVQLNFPVAIAIAITKATLVILFFMHVKYSSRLTKMVVGMAFFFLIIMLGLTLTDYLSRGWFASPRGSTGAGTRVTLTSPSGGAPPPAQPVPPER